MKIKFELTYAEVSIIHNALSDFIDKTKEIIEANNDDSNIIYDSVAWKLYAEFREVIDDINNS